MAAEISSFFLSFFLSFSLSLSVGRCFESVIYDERGGGRGGTKKL